MTRALPQITQHGYMRAKERMHLSAVGFDSWVAATFSNWMPVNADYLLDRGVNCSSRGAVLFMNPWTFMERVALILSEDNAIKTVIVFEDRITREVKDAPKIPAAKKVHEGIMATALRMVLDNHAPPRDVIRRSIGDCNLAFEASESAMVAYGRNEIDFTSLKKIVQAKRDQQVKFLCEALSRNGEAI